MSWLCFLVLFISTGSSVTGQSDGFNLSFTQSEIIPDVLSVAPSYYMSVHYPDVQPNGVLIAGDVLTPTQVKDVPIMTWDYKRDKFYTIMMTDPDAPSREKPVYREWLHWLVVNVPGADIAAGDTIAEYVGAGPGKDTGLHRYVLVVYEQPYKMTFNETRLTNRSTNHRALFSISKFAKKYDLGDPIAGNFFQAEYDDYVPILYQQLGVSGGQRTTLNSNLIAFTSVVMALSLVK